MIDRRPGVRLGALSCAAGGNAAAQRRPGTPQQTRPMQHSQISQHDSPANRIPTLPGPRPSRTAGPPVVSAAAYLPQHVKSQSVVGRLRITPRTADPCETSASGRYSRLRSEGDLFIKTPPGRSESRAPRVAANSLKMVYTRSDWRSNVNRGASNARPSR